MISCNVCWDKIHEEDGYQRWGWNETAICIACAFPKPLRILPADGWHILYDGGSESRPWFTAKVVGWAETKDEGWRPIAVARNGPGDWCGCEESGSEQIARVYHESEIVGHYTDQCQEWIRKHRSELEASRRRAEERKAEVKK